MAAVEKGAWVRMGDGALVKPLHPIGTGGIAWECVLVPPAADLLRTDAEPRPADILTRALEAAERADDAECEETLAAAIAHTLTSAERRVGRMRALLEGRADGAGGEAGR